MKLPPANSKVLLLLVVFPIIIAFVVLATKAPAQDAVPTPLDGTNRPSPSQVPSFGPESVPDEDRLPIAYLTKMPRHAVVTLLFMSGRTVTGKLLMVKEDNGVICLEREGKRGWYKASSLEGVETK